MAECSGDCSSYAPDTSTEWFKIDEQGLTSSGTWAQASLDSGAPANVTIPDNLKSGQYLLRHELIALQGAQSSGGAEFYPACAQLTIGGSGTGTPDTTVQFPGAYSASDAGILVDVYTGLTSYVFPGGAVASISGSSSSGSSSGSDSDSGSGAASVSGTATGSASVPSSTSTDSSGSGSGSGTSTSSGDDAGSTGKCSSKKFKLKRRAANSTTSTGSAAKKRHAQKMQRKRLAAFEVSSN